METIQSRDNPTLQRLHLQHLVTITTLEASQMCVYNCVTDTERSGNVVEHVESTTVWIIMMMSLKEKTKQANFLKLGSTTLSIIIPMTQQFLNTFRREFKRTSLLPNNTDQGFIQDSILKGEI